MSFANGRDPQGEDVGMPEQCGAIVEVVWPRKTIDAQSGDFAIKQGLNQSMQI